MKKVDTGEGTMSIEVTQVTLGESQKMIGDMIHKSLVWMV